MDLLHSYFPAEPISETGGVKVEAVTALDRRTMEWDADRVAFLIATEKGMTQLLGQNFREATAGERRSAFLTLQAGYHILFRLIQQIESFSTPLEDRSHPLPYDRSHLLFTKSLGVASEWGFELTIQDLGDCLVMAEKAWASGFNEEDVMPFHVAGDDIAADISAICKNWETLRPRLVPLNRGNTELAPIWQN